MEMFAEMAEAVKPDTVVKLNFQELSGKSDEMVKSGIKELAEKTKPVKEDPIAVLETKTKALTVKPDFKIMTEPEYDIALEKLKDFTALDKEVHKLTDPVCESTNTAHKDATGLRSKLLKPITTIKTAYQRAIGDYDYQKELIQRAAAKKIEDERLKKIEAMKLEKAEELEEAGKPEEAEAVLDLDFTPAPIAIEKVKVSGLQYRDNWQAEVIDKSKIPMEYLIPDLSAMTKHAKEIAASTKRKDPNAEIVSDITGVKFVNLRKAIV